MIVVMVGGVWAVIANNTNNNRGKSPQGDGAIANRLGGNSGVGTPQPSTLAANPLFNAAQPNRNNTSGQTTQPSVPNNQQFQDRNGVQNNPAAARPLVRPRQDMEPLGSREVSPAPVNPPAVDQNALRNNRNGGGI